jgi:hypothetical protein
MTKDSFLNDEKGAARSAVRKPDGDPELDSGLKKWIALDYRQHIGS